MPPLDHSHFVPVTRPATDLTGTQALRGWISFPASGGAQVVDQNGVVTNIAGSSGGGVALLAATQTFTGKNTFAPAAAAVPIGTPSFAVNLAATQTLAAGSPGGFQGAAVLIPGTYLGTAPGTTVDAVATLYVAGAPTVGANLTAEAYGLIVGGAGYFLDNLATDGDLAVDGDITVNDGLEIVGDALSPTFTATRTNGGLSFIPDGTGNIDLCGSDGTPIVSVDRSGGAPRLGFFNVTPLIRQTVADCVVGVDGTSAGTQLNALLARLRLYGLLT